MHAYIHICKDVHIYITERSYSAAFICAIPSGNATRTATLTPTATVVRKYNRTGANPPPALLSISVLQCHPYTRFTSKCI